MKDFKEELNKIYNRLRSGQNFAFSKYADGEDMVMKGEPVDNGEFNFLPYSHEFYRQKLIESLKFKHPDYYVGISCECCQGDKHRLMKHFSEQGEENLTFANVFVNSNYPEYVDKFIPYYATKNVHLIANHGARIDNLPFTIEEYYPVGNTAFVNDYELIEKIKSKNLKDKLFLFCAGPFGNLLAHQLFKDNQDNTYLDIGSTLNPWLQSEGFRREYYMGIGYGNRTCVWP